DVCSSDLAVLRNLRLMQYVYHAGQRTTPGQAPGTVRQATRGSNMRHRNRVTPAEMVEGVTYYATIPHIINAKEDDTATLDPRALLDPEPFEDRKSTRLNSSHVKIS